MKLPRFLKILLTFLLSSLILLISSALVVVYFYEDEVKQVLVSQINKQLATPVSVKDIKLSLLKKFPNATLEFIDVSAKSVQSPDSLNKSEGFADTLFKAHKIFLQFNVLDIFHKRYKIKKIDIENGMLCLLINEKGEDNFHFWKKSNASENSNFSLMLESISVSDISLLYQNEQSKHIYSLVIKESKLNGNFSESQYTLATKGDYYVDAITIDKTNYLKRKSINLEGTLHVSNNERYEIQEVSMLLNELNFDLSGFYLSKKTQNDEINLVIKGKNLDIKTLVSLLPDVYKKNLNTYSSSGLFYFNALISGEVGEGSKPKILADFGVKNGAIQEAKSSLNLDKISLRGNFTNGKNRSTKSSSLAISNFSAQLGSGKLAGNFSIKNFENPYLNVVAEANLNLAQVKEFLKLDTLEICSGNLTLDIDFSGNTNHISHFSEADFAKTQTQGSLNLEQGSIKFVGAKQSLENVNASLMFNNNDIVVNECNGKIQDSDFALKGFFRNALAAAFNKDEKLYIDASLSSRLINLNQLLADGDASTKNKKAFELHFSDRINFSLNVDVRSLVFKRFEASSIKGIAKLQDKKLALSPVSFSTLDGAVMATGIIDGSSDNGFKTICDAELKNINVSKLFYAFENFGGTTLTDKNIKGIAASSIQFSGDYKADLTSKTESILSRFDLTIENGELLNFEPMRKLSRFISLSELNDIRFASLKNTIEIKNRKIIIPSMEIKSSAINLNVAGTHTFDNFVDYHFKLLLSELLSKKAKKAKKENDDFGVVEDDGLGLGKTAIYISMAGPLENPKITYDRSGLKMQMKQNVKSETQNLKSILRNEFGWFMKDSTITPVKVKKQNPRFETEWEESKTNTIDKANNTITLPKVKAENSMSGEPKKIKVLDNLFKKEEELQKKKKQKKEKAENSDDFN